MPLDPRSLLKRDSATLAGDALMQAAPGVLRGVDAAQQAALEALGIRTVFDLAASAAFAAARRLLLLQDDATQPEAQLQRVAADIADVPAGVPVAELALLPIQALKAVGAQRARALRTALATTTVRDLALWPPARAARALLAEQLAGDDPVPVGDPGTPPELLPRNGAFPTERVLYRSLLIDSVSDRGVQPLEQLGDALSLGDVLSGSGQGFDRLASGALLTFAQDWFAQGVALGQLLHSLSLAPGESTRMAMIDWSRQSRGSGSEDIDEAERLANTTTHQRALSEVTQATATEVQGGSSRSTSTSSASQSGSALGFEIGPVAFGGSSGGGGTSTEALTVTSSFGRRNLAASVAQQINDVSQQHASAARSRRASIVQEVAQSEREALSTRVVCNYNHMHALNVQYYEVVQAFRVTTTLQRAERVLFVPVKLVDFDDPLVLERWRGVLADAALSDDIRRQLTTEFGVVEIVPNLPRLRIGEAVLTATLRGAELAGRVAAASVAGSATRLRDTAGATAEPRPAASARLATSLLHGIRFDAAAIRTEAFAAATPEAATAATEAVRDLRFDLGPAQSGATLTALKGFDPRQIGRLAAVAGRTVLRNASDAVFVPDEARLHGLAVLGARASGLAVRTRAGADLPGNAASPTQLTLAAPARFADLGEVRVLLRPDDQPGAAKLRLLVEIGGTVLPLDVPVQLPRPGQATAIVRFEAARAAPALLAHLRANALHYSRAVFERLDAATLSGLLSGFTLRGVPLGALVDPQPVALVANALVLRLNLPARGAVPENPALAAEAEEWQRFLQRRGLDRPVPQSQTVPLPSGGVFAEAVLGRFNSAEKIDLTRFFDWQASPIPLTPPDIAALPAGSRRRALDLSTGALGAPLLKQTEPTPLPAGAGAAAVLAALQAGSPFRDLSAVIAGNAGLAQSGSELAGAGATAAATQAADTLQTVMAQNTERLKIAADLFLATQGGGDAGGKASPTQTGLAMTTADRQDKAAQGGGGASPGAPGATTGQPGADSGASLEQQAQAAQTGASAAAATQQAVDTIVDGTKAEATPAPARSPRRAGRRVQPSTTPAPSPSPGSSGGFGGAIARLLTDVSFTVQLLAAPGARVPQGERRLRIADADGRTVLSLNSQANELTGTRPPSDKPVTFVFEIRSENPAYTLATQRQMITPPGLAVREILQVRPVLAKRQVQLVDPPLSVLLATEAQLLALPEVQAFAAELPRLAAGPKIDLRAGKVFVVFSVFETQLQHRQIVA
jgi:hypothetical protein